MPALGAVEHLVGLQAQAPGPPYVGLWTRLVDFEASELAGLISGRSVVRIALHRGTIHAVSARDALVLRPLLQPLFDRSVRRREAQLVGAPAEAVVAAARELVEGNPLTFADLGRRLAERWPNVEPGVLAQLARGALALVQVPPRGLWGAGGRAAYTTLEAWVDSPLDRTGTLEALLVRYLAAFGPASVRDAQTWSGLTGLGAVAERARGRLRVFRDEDGRELLDLPGAPRPDPARPAPVRFLPPWDNVLRSHADRTRVMADAVREALRRPNDVVPGTVLVDGFVAATWTQAVTADAATLEIELLRRLSRRDADAVAAEGRRLLRWAAPGLPRRVAVSPPA